MPTEEEIQEAKRKADEEEVKRKAAEETSDEDEETETEEELSLEELKAKLAKSEAARKAANKEAKDRRLKLEALEEEKKKREEAELSEAQKATKRAEEAEARATALEKETQELKLKDKFRSKASELKLSFVTPKAEEDAFSHLDPATIGDDLEGLDDAIKQVQKDRPYLFGKPDPNQEVTDGSKKGRLNNVTVEKTVLEKKRASGLIGPI